MMIGRYDIWYHVHEKTTRGISFCRLRFLNSFDSRISEKEFLRATLHYRRLGNLLSIDYLEKCRQEIVRKIKALVDDVKKEGCSSTCGLVLTVKELS